MAVTFAWLNTTIQLTDSAAAYVTNAANTKTHIDGIYIHNTHSSAITVTLYLVPATGGGAVGTAGTGNQIYKKSLDSEASVTINDIELILDTENDSLQAVADTASKVNVFVFGQTVT